MHFVPMVSSTLSDLLNSLALVVRIAVKVQQLHATNLLDLMCPICDYFVFISFPFLSMTLDHLLKGTTHQGRFTVGHTGLCTLSM